MTACAPKPNEWVTAVFPSSPALDDSIPSPVIEYLTQALDSIHAPAGAVMLASSAVEAMLKANDYRDGRLYDKIEKAAADHLITQDMAKWAHQVRLDANEPRHADEENPLPTEEDACRTVEFAQALAQFLFVLPASVEKGLAETKGE